MNSNNLSEKMQFKNLASNSSFVFGAINGSLALLLYIGVASLALSSNTSTTSSSISNQRSDSPTASRQEPAANDKSGISISSGNPRTDTNVTTNSSENLSISGIDLPITNTLCTKKGNFCIYGLAQLLKSKSGEASYKFSEQVQGENVSINGKISINNISQSSSGSSAISLNFQDDQSTTTPGWAAAGSFVIAQDPDSSKPGILAKFKTFQSFGPKTPVGLENKSYLFPAQ